VERARRIEDETEARRCLFAAKRAGQTAGEWARAHAIDGRSLHAWKINLERGSPPGTRRPPAVRSAPRTIVELVPETAGGPPSTPSRATPNRYVLEVAGARVEFGDDASTATLRRVLEALRPC
jgi:hypothetical protein